ncbi:MAG: hypothetical protein RH942_19795 [Kiloniellaceae bacterium]
MKHRTFAILSLTAGLLAAAAPAVAQTGYLTISKADCARLAIHHSAADVAFQPGRDVRGRPVAPADFDGGSGLILPEAVVIPIEVDLFERFGIPANGATFTGDVFVGEVVVDVASGRAIFNGQPLQSETEADLAARCQRIVRDRDPAG